MSSDPRLYWAICRIPTRPGAWVGVSDLCHLHQSRGVAIQCGIARPGAPELVAVRAEPGRTLTYRVVYSLSHAVTGRLARAGQA